MRKLFLLLILLLSSTAWGTEWWNDTSLTFYAPFDNVAAPLTLNKGTGSLSFTRATSATYVHPTTGLITTAADNVLRIESNGALIEGQRTNLALQSEDFSITWVIYATTLSLDNVVAPDGNLTADYLLETNATAEHYIQQDMSGLADDTFYAFSVYGKRGPTGRNVVRLYFLNKSGVWGHSAFYLDNCSVKSLAGVTSSMAQTAPNGYCRMSIWNSLFSGVVVPAIAVQLVLDDETLSYAGDNTVGIYLWGAQLEAASFASSYIPTTTAGVTRNRDQLTFVTSGNVSGTVGTVATSYKTIANAGATSQYLIDFNNGRPVLFVNGADEKLSINDGATTTSFGTADTHGTTYKGASRWDVSDHKERVVRGGGTVVDGVFDDDMNLGTNATIGDSGTTTSILWGNIKNLRIWNRAFTDYDLQRITWYGGKMSLPTFPSFPSFPDH